MAPKQETIVIFPGQQGENQGNQLVIRDTLNLVASKDEENFPGGSMSQNLPVVMQESRRCDFQSLGWKIH